MSSVPSHALSFGAAAKKTHLCVHGSILFSLQNYFRMNMSCRNSYLFVLIYSLKMMILHLVSAFIDLNLIGCFVCESFFLSYMEVR